MGRHAVLSTGSLWLMGANQLFKSQDSAVVQCRV